MRCHFGTSKSNDHKRRRPVIRKNKMNDKMNPIAQNEIEDRIFTIRGVQVMLDSHLAEMY